jgi:hypothetical protein
VTRVGLWLTIGAAAMALAVGPVSGSALAAIVVGKSVDGVVIGMSQASVRWKLGQPLRVVNGKNEFGSYTQFRYRGYVVDFQGGRHLTSVQTTLARERTARGIGVGATWDQVRARVPHVVCEGSTLNGHCHVGKLLPGRIVTDFFVHKGRVHSVLVGIVLD